MGEGAGSQSAITLKLNSLSRRRVGGANPDGWPREVLEKLRSARGTADLVALASEVDIDGVRVANKSFERRHIEIWPRQQQELVRQVLIHAISQGRQVVYDWNSDPEVKFTVRDMGDIIGITFYNPPGHGMTNPPSQASAE
jgi:hypothetical protein